MNSPTATVVFALLSLSLAGAQEGLPHSTRPATRSDAPAEVETPVDDTAGNHAERSGVVKAKTRTKPTRITNNAELKRLDLIPRGYSYAVEGEYTKYDFQAKALTLTAPDGSRTIRLERFEGTANVQREAGQLVAHVADVPRALRVNPTLRLEELLRKEIRAHGAGHLVLRGWAIDVETACDTERTLLLDGVQARAGDEEPAWILQHYNRKGNPKRPIVLQQRGTMQFGIPLRKVTVIRHEPAAQTGLSEAVTQD